MSFNSDEIERYARHIVLREMGGMGQQRLKQSRVLVIGAGGLGAPVIQYLAAAGVGTLEVVDDDVVSLSNLQRQIIHRTADIDRPKVESAARYVEALNPNVTLIGHALRLDQENAADLIGPCDLVCDGSDNFKTRYLVADTCEALETTLVTAAVGRFEGSLTTVKPHSVTSAGDPAPRYRDIFPEQPPQGLIPSCEEAGIVGALTGILGTMQAMEAIKELTGMGSSLAGRLLLVDALTLRFDEMRYRRKA